MKKLLLLLTLVGCNFSSMSDNNCHAACLKWRQLGCFEGNDSPTGKTCEASCKEELLAGSGPKTICVVKSTSCKEARACWSQ